MDTRTAVDEAVAAFTEMLADPVVGDRWAEASALPGYSVGGLAAHVGHAVSWAATLVAAEPASDDVCVVGRGGYFAIMKRLPGEGAATGHDRIVALGERAAGHGWEATCGHVEEAAARLRGALPGADLERIVDLGPTLPFATTLDTLLATRVVELVVHGDDLAVSIGRPGLDPGRAAYAVCAELLVATAVVQHDRLSVVRALTRRERVGDEVFPVF